MDPLLANVLIRAPRSSVWSALADLEAVSDWNPSVAAAECISAEVAGIGARRRCWMHPSGSMTESVSEWDPEQVIAFTVDRAAPIATGLVRFVLKDSGAGTRLDASFDYEVRLGRLGPIIDRLIVHRHLSSAWSEAIQGLRFHVEGREDPDQIGRTETSPK